MYLYNKKHGSLQKFLCGTVGKEQRSQSVWLGSNHGVDNRIVDLAKKKILIEYMKLLCDVEVVRRTGGELGKG